MYSGIIFISVHNLNTQLLMLPTQFSKNLHVSLFLFQVLDSIFSIHVQTFSLSSGRHLNFQSLITAPPLNLFSILKQHPRNRHQSYSNKTQQARRPPNTQSPIHLQRKKGKHGSQRVPQKAACRECRGAVQRLHGPASHMNRIESNQIKSIARQGNSNGSQLLIVSYISAATA